MSNNSSNNNTATGGIGFCGLLAIVFIVLKLIGKIYWSWWWVLAPIWAVPAVIIACGVLFFVIRFFVKKRFICLFKGHDFVEHTCARPVDYGCGLDWIKIKECKRCGKKERI